MSLSLERLTKEEWAALSQSAHKYSFGTDRSPEMDRIDFALVVRETERDVLTGYMTVIELDQESAYIQHGGNFHHSDRNILTLRSYMMMCNFMKEKYKNVSTRVWNKNKAMLKISWAAGFTVVGCEVGKNKELYLVLDLE
jgi:L-amino acid N-acyltransferase YncA